mgnify:CR=1 FL=1
MKLLLIAETPVAGTVARMAQHLNAIDGMTCRHLILRNYAHNAFAPQTPVMLAQRDWRAQLATAIAEAEVVIAHNVVDSGLLAFIHSLKRPYHHYAYHLHSAPGEPPQFTFHHWAQYRWDALFAVAQGQQRFIKDAVPIANIIADSVSTSITRQADLLLPMLRSTSFRWSHKIHQDDITLLRRMTPATGIDIRDIASVFGRETVTHDELTYCLPSMRYVIDDLHSGLIHQTAFEALKVGTLVFSAADPITIDAFCEAADCPPPPVLPVTCAATTAETLCRLKGDAWRPLSEKAQAYGENYLGAARLANCMLTRIRQALL